MLQLKDFTPHIDQTFSIHLEQDEALDANLVEVKDMSHDDREHLYEKNRRPFSLLFKTDKSIFLPQKRYKLSHGEMGDLDVFLVPIYDEPDGFVYEAMFN